MQATAVAPEAFDPEVLRAPTKIPEDIALVVETNSGPPELANDLAIGIPSGPAGVPWRIPNSVLGPQRVHPPPPPPPAVPPKPAVPKTVRISSTIQSAKLAHKVLPNYPAIAKQAGISGIVKIEAIIARDGSIRKLKVMSGHPLLIKPAIEAVRQWRYRPTLLNGEAVEVFTQVEVRFVLR
jgi:protein TonB